MIFILTFSFVVLCIPLAVEIYKHGDDNILARAGQEILASGPFQRARDTLRTLRASSRQSIAAVVAMLIVGLSMITGEGLIRALGVFMIATFHSVIR